MLTCALFFGKTRPPHGWGGVHYTPGASVKLLQKWPSSRAILVNCPSKSAFFVCVANTIKYAVCWVGHFAGVGEGHLLFKVVFVR